MSTRYIKYSYKLTMFLYLKLVEDTQLAGAESWPPVVPAPMVGVLLPLLLLLLMLLLHLMLLHDS